MRACTVFFPSVNLIQLRLWIISSQKKPVEKPVAPAEEESAAHDLKEVDRQGQKEEAQIEQTGKYIRLMGTSVHLTMLKRLSHY